MDFIFERKINYYETDRMGVVHHSNYIRFLEENYGDKTSTIKFIKEDEEKYYYEKRSKENNKLLNKYEVIKKSKEIKIIPIFGMSGE